MFCMNLHFFQTCTTTSVETIMREQALPGKPWRTSVGLNRLLCGSAQTPLCARIHAARPSRLRSVAMFLLDIAFAEYRHTARVHRRWLDLSKGDGKRGRNS